MPQTKSAKKALRKDRKREAVNKKTTGQYKKALKQARKKPDKEALRQASSLLDRAAKKGILHKNKAARLKSRLAKLATKNAPVVTKASAKAKKKRK
ncbi:MAG: 30S ribosomal protein S20 [bacterium]|nr:30S ribosomal protein S20 [bacterium]